MDGHRQGGPRGDPSPHTRLPPTDETLLRRVIGVLTPIGRWYFRETVRGLERVPDEPTLLVANHDGGVFPVDTVLFGAAWHRHFGFARPLRILMHEIPFHLGRGLRAFLHGIGCVSASPRWLEASLEANESVIVLPGAAWESFRPWRERRVVELGGRSGFVRRALRWRRPITPVVTAGAHEMMFIVRRGHRLARRLGISRTFRADAWPLVVGLPWGVWLGPLLPYIPLPAKITIEVLAPIRLERVLGRPIRDGDADDDQVVRRCFTVVRQAMQAGIHRLYDERRLPVIG